MDMKYKCAGIVTYNPELNRLKQNIDAIINSLDTLIIVDNNSKNIEEIKKLLSEYDILKINVKIIENKENKGIAYALNQIVQESISNAFDWTLLLDQDSICDKNIFNIYYKYFKIKNLALLSPYIIDINKMTLDNFRNLHLKNTSNVKYAITSGSLINNTIYLKVGGFDNKLFIDTVDIDFSKRLNINGYLQLRVNETYLLQEVGKAEKTKIYRLHKDNANKFSIQPLFRTNHSLNRQYYMAKNNVIIARKYKNYDSVIKNSVFVFLYLCSKLLVEHNKINLLKVQIKGIKDGIKESIEVYEKP